MLLQTALWTVTTMVKNVVEMALVDFLSDSSLLTWYCFASEKTSYFLHKLAHAVGKPVHCEFLHIVR